MMLTDLADVLRAAGVQVVEIGGWKSRGHAQMNPPKSVVCHHTASSASGGNTASLNVVTYGRSDLAGPLCHILLARNGVAYVVAAGVAWHAGATIDDAVYGNYNSIGIEAENNGIGEPWGDAQVDAYAKICAALCRRYGFGVDRVKGHKEICKPAGRKIDPAGLPGDMNGLRARVQSYLSGSVLNPVPAPSADNDEETTMIVPAGVNEHVVVPAAGRPLYLYIYTAFGRTATIHQMTFIGQTPAGGGAKYLGGTNTDWTFQPDRPGPVALPFGTVGVVLRYTADHPFTAYVG